MFEDIQFYLEKSQQSQQLPATHQTSQKSQTNIKNSNIELPSIKNESNRQHHNPEEVDEGPTLALFLLSNTQFKNMTNLNEKLKQKHLSQELDEDYIEDEMDEHYDEADQFQKQQTIPIEIDVHTKNHEDLDDIFFQTEVVYFDNELQEIPLPVKSRSTILKPSSTNNGESPQPLIKESTDKISTSQILTTVSQKDFNNFAKHIDLSNTISKIKNSLQYNTTKSTLISKTPNSNIYLKSDSLVSQMDEMKLPVVNKQKSTIVEESSVGYSTMLGISGKRRKKLSSQPHKLKFRWRIFFEFLLYHCLYLLALGPLACLIIIYVFKQNKVVCKNMGFIGFNRVNAYQCVLYLFFLLGVLIYFNISKQVQAEYLIFFLTFLYTYIIKILIMTLKYGFYTQHKIKAVKSRILTWEEQRQDFIFGLWVEQTDEIIRNELENAMERLEVEPSSFYFEFMTTPQKDQLEKLLAPERKKIILKKHGGEGDFDLTKLPYGTNLLMEYIRYYRRKFSYKWMRRIAVFISFLRQIYLITLKVQCVLKIINSTMEMTNIIAINIFFALMEFFFWIQIIEILFLYFQDLRRKTFIMNQMSHLISAKRVEIELEGTKKLYPTLELVCPISLRTWATLRKITLEYGEKFSKRIQILVSIFISFFIVIISLYFLQRINVIGFVNIQTEVVYLYIFDISCIIIITIKCIFMGGKINEHFDIHIQKLYQNKIQFLELLSKYTIWFKEDYVVVNPLFRRMIEDYRILKRNFNFNDRQLQTFIKDNIHLCTMQILDIEIQARDNPYKVFGIAMTEQLGFTILTAFISLIASLLVKYVSSQPSAINNLTF